MYVYIGRAHGSKEVAVLPVAFAWSTRTKDGYTFSWPLHKFQDFQTVAIRKVTNVTSVSESKAVSFRDDETRKVPLANNKHVHANIDLWLSSSLSPCMLHWFGVIRVV